MDCPRCSVEMTEISGKDDVAHRCSTCGGIWIDNTDLNRVLLHHNLPALTALGGRVNVEEMAGMCPTCNVDLVVVEGGERRSLHYDTCESCGGIWVENTSDGDVPETATFKDAETMLVDFYRRFRVK
jgi:Zn-finger nucleic acid-binding protein